MISDRELRLLNAYRRTNFTAFARSAFHIFAPGEQLVWNWHLDAICFELERVL